MMLLSEGDPLTPAGGSSWSLGKWEEQLDVPYKENSVRTTHLLKSRISLLRAGVVILVQFTVRVRGTRRTLDKS